MINQFLLKAIKTGDLNGFSSAGFTKDYFEEDSEKELFERIADHGSKYRKMPDVSTVESWGVTLADIDLPEPIEYYADKTVQWYRGYLIGQQVAKVRASLIDGDTPKAESIIQALSGQLSSLSSKDKIIDFTTQGYAAIKEFQRYQREAPRIITGFPTFDAISSGMMPGDVNTIVGRPGMGKAQPLTSDIKTVNGWVKMGSIKVGDELASVDGGKSFVEGVFPQGVKPIYKVTFSDGRFAECSDEHLWEVTHRSWSDYRVVTTKELIELLKVKRNARRLYTRSVSGHVSLYRERPLIQDYTLGALLGDGSFRGSTLTLTSADEHILSKVSSQLVEGYSLKHASRYDYRITHGNKSIPNIYKQELVRLGLWGFKSEGKHIPREYMEGSYQQRLDLLQGLMDTDGYAQFGTCQYSSSSLQLVLDVQELARSLGAKATLQATHTTTHLDSYRLSIRMPKGVTPFSLPRKVQVNPIGKGFNGNTITSVEYLRDDVCQCIMVSHPSHLYITDGYIVTHNTMIALRMCFSAWQAGVPVLALSTEMEAIQLILRTAGLYTKINPNKFKKGYLSSLGGSDEKSRFKDLENLASKGLPEFLMLRDKSMSVPSIYSLAESHGVGLVLIDGAYLLKQTSGFAKAKHERISDTIELIKECTTKTVTLATYQLNREAEKKIDKSKAEDISLGDIAGADAIGQISSVVMAMFQPEGDVRTTKSRKVNILKGREGETGSFTVSWEFDPMKIEEQRFEYSDDFIDFDEI